MTRRTTCISIAFACALALAPRSALAQRRGPDTALPNWSGGAVDGATVLASLAAPVVRDAPYAAEAVTTLTQVLADGTKIERTVNARVFRDSMGRTRREQTVIGLGSLTAGADALRVITITDPVERVTYTINEQTRTARRGPLLGVFFQLQSRVGNDPSRVYQVRLPADAERQAAEIMAQLDLAVQPATNATRATATLASKQIEGVTATGRRTTQTIPAGAIGNDRPIVITEETWQSPDLQVVVSSHHADPRTGTVDYRLTNIDRSEPAADLFMVPAGYTVIGPPIAPLAPGGSPRDGGRGRGGRGTP